MHGMFKVNSNELREINDLSVYLGFDLIITEDIMEVVDPNGHHLISVLYFHEGHGKCKVTHSYRCRALIKIKNTMKPSIQILDCDINQLNEHTTYIANNVQADA